MCAFPFRVEDSRMTIDHILFLYHFENINPQPSQILAFFLVRNWMKIIWWKHDKVSAPEMVVTYTVVFWEKELLSEYPSAREKLTYFLIYLNLIKRCDFLKCVCDSFYKSTVVREYLGLSEREPCYPSTTVWMLACAHSFCQNGTSYSNLGKKKELTWV